MTVIHQYQHKEVNRQVFRAYDIRGIVEQELDADAFYSIGRAISCQLRSLDREGIFLGRDGRLSSDGLCHALQQGLLDSGITVYDLGAIPTPIMYFATHCGPVDSGLIVTGSHNPAEYNGIKMVLAGKTLANKDIDLLHELVQKKEIINGTGTYIEHSLTDAYMQRIISDIQLKRPLKVVVDCGNGIAGPLIPKVLTALGCEVIPLYCEVDGRFLHHHPDPTIEANLADLKKVVAETHADLGLAFDGDADRLGMVTNLNEVIWPDRLMMLFSQEVLKRNPGATIVYDVKCSNHLTEIIINAGGKPRMCQQVTRLLNKL